MNAHIICTAYGHSNDNVGYHWAYESGKKPKIALHEVTNSRPCKSLPGTTYNFVNSSTYSISTAIIVIGNVIMTLTMMSIIVKLQVNKTAMHKAHRNLLHSVA